MPEPYRRKPEKVTRASAAGRGVVKVDADFKREYPDGDAASTEAFATLVRVGAACQQELERYMSERLDLPITAATALAVLDGAGVPLTPSEIGDRVLVASATMTSTLDLLERRGLVERKPNPEDRRSVNVEITDDGRATADLLLPGIRVLERTSLGLLTKSERVELLALLSKVLVRLAESVEQPPPPAGGKRNRPERLQSRARSGA